MKMTKADPSAALNQQDAARRLGVSDRTLRRWQINGEIPYMKIGGTIRYSQAVIEARLRGETVTEGASNGNAN